MSLLFIVQFLMGISILVAASRQTWAFSRDGALPFSTFFRPISQKFGYIPLRTIWGCATLAALLGLLTLIAPAAAQAVFSLAVAVSFQINCPSLSHADFLTSASIRAITSHGAFPSFRVSSGASKNSNRAPFTPAPSQLPSPGPPSSSSSSVLSSPCSLSAGPTPPVSTPFFLKNPHAPNPPKPSPRINP